jgi:hypothetical protein
MDRCFRYGYQLHDGRVQEPVITWMKDAYGVQYVDDVTEPGPICMLAATPMRPPSNP